MVTEFIGIATSLELFGLSRYVTVPVCAVIVWLIVVKGQYKSVEKVFLAASFFYITYIFAGALAHPAWKAATVATFKPPALGAFPRTGLPVHGDRRGRDHDRTLDAVLSSGLGCGKRRNPARAQCFALGRNHRLHFHRHGGVVHHCGLRRDACTCTASATSSMRPTPPRP